MNRGQRTRQRHSLAQFPQGHVRTLPQQAAQLPAVTGQNQGLSSRPVMAGTEISRAPPLLEELFDHPQRDAVTPGNLLPGGAALIVGLEDPFAKVQ